MTQREYIVCFHHPTYGSWAYAVNAEDEGHAKEQVLDAEPEAKNLFVSVARPEPNGGNDE
tara:strand:- start:425 stop:604 length:180 start_codon:yes stop_codon:yes gene_type:complete